VSRRRRPPGDRSQAGQAGGVEVLAFGVLVFLVGTLVVTNAWGVVDAKLAVSSAARQAARTYVETGGSGADADTAATQSAMETLANLHRAAGSTVSPEAGTYGRCTRVSFKVSTVVPFFHLPWVASTRSGFTVSAVHSELVDPYRSGPDGVASC